MGYVKWKECGEIEDRYWLNVEILHVLGGRGLGEGNVKDRKSLNLSYGLEMISEWLKSQIDQKLVLSKNTF